MAGPASFARACLRLRYDPESVEPARAAVPASPAAWRALRTLVHAEHLGPLMHHTAGARGMLPAALAQLFQRSHRITAMRNRLLLRDLAAALRALAAAGIDAIVLKGAALAAVVYRDPALRPMVDADVLIRAGDRARARDVLGQIGYAVAGAETRLGMLLEHECELELRNPGLYTGVIDLHWSLFDSPQYQRTIDMTWFWRTAEPAEVAGVPVQVLGSEALLLHLCGHLALHHGGRGLLWWHDVAELLATVGDRLDWDEILARARRDDLLLPLRLVLSELAARWGAPVPAGVVAALHALHPSRDEAWVFARLHRGRSSAGQRLWTDLASMSSWASRWRFAGATVFPSADYMRWRYDIRHPLLLPFYYPYRWLRGVRGA